MIDVKTAVTAAFTAVRDLYESSDLEDLTLEEAELLPDSSAWTVTLSHARDLSGMEGFGGHHRRAFKVFTIAADSGTVQAMRHRDT